MTKPKAQPEPVVEDVDAEELDEMVAIPAATSAAMLCANVDVNDLLERFNGDSRQVFDLLGKLKDLLR